MFKVSWDTLIISIPSNIIIYKCIFHLHYFISMRIIMYITYKCYLQRALPLRIITNNLEYSHVEVCMFYALRNSPVDLTRVPTVPLKV